jgi:dienelactone hydrolase
MLRPILAFVALSSAAAAFAEIKTERVEYRDGDVVLEGFIAYDTAKAGPRPAMMIVHDWNGPDQYEENRARMLAELGYVGFAADIYGKGVRPKSAQENAQQAGKYRGDMPTFLSRMNAALSYLKSRPEVDKAKLGAMGYCFGGGGVLELARSGAEVPAIISFHGGLATQKRAAEGSVKSRIMVIHGSQDPSMPYAQLVGFLEEMRDAKADYQLIAYNVDSHPFTVPGGPGYREAADKRSWEELKRFLQEVWGA